MNKYIHILLAVALSSCAGTAIKSESQKPAISTATSKSSSSETTSSYKTIIGDVDGIVCAFCVQGIQKRFQSLGKADQVVISLEHKKVVVTEKPGQVISDSDFRQTIREAGFKVESIKRSPLPLASIKRRLAHEQSLFAQTPLSSPPVTLASH